MNVRALVIAAICLLAAGFSTVLARPHDVTMRPVPALASGAPVPSSPAKTATADTFWFGGTHWDTAQSRWEASMSTSRTNRWTFDSGIGGSAEGWTGDDKTLLPFPTCPRAPLGTPDNADFRWTNSILYAAYGTPGTSIFPSATPPDTGALWCAKYDLEADELCWPSQGYGPHWNHEARKVFPYGGTGDARITFKYFNDTEKNYDFTYLYLEFNGVQEPTPRVTMTYTLGSPGSKRVRTITVNASAIPAGTTSIRTVFNFTSDEGWSSGFTDYLGGFCCYEFLYEDLGTPANTDQDTFEGGPEGWQFVQKPAVGDFVRAADLGTLTPPSVPCPVLRDNVLVMSRAAGPPRHPVGQDNFALSPVIDIDEFGLGSTPIKLAFGDAFLDMPLNNGVYYKLWLRQYPVYCQVTGQPIEDYVAPDGFITYAPVPSCDRNVMLEDFSASAAGIDYCRLAIEVLNLCAVSATCTDPTGGNESPYWDNLTFAVTNDIVVSAGAVEAPKANTLEISPNPFNPLLKLSYAVAAPGRVALRIYDTEGALVRTLVEKTMPAGRYDALWNGTDEAGRRLASGVFWARYETPGSKIVKQLVLLK